MRIQSVVNLGKEYLILGIIMALVFVSIVCIGYFGIYKKLLKGDKKLKFFQLCWWAVFICYMIVVLGATMFSRVDMRGIGDISIFNSYKEAWINASAVAWRNIILNILLFVPFGFLLPIGKERFRVFWKTYLAGLSLTVTIELLQLILARGIFEVVDLFNNVLGTMIGFGCYAIVRLIVIVCKKGKIKVVSTLLLQLPLLFTISLFSTIYIVYEMQELGNLRCEYIAAYDKNKLDIVSDEKYSDRETTAMVYKVPIRSNDETRQMADEFFALMGTKVDESRIDLYDETAFYWSDGSYNMVIEYLGGTYEITDFDTIFSKDENGNKQVNEIYDASEETIREALGTYGISIPEGADYSNTKETGYQFELSQFKIGEKVYDGTLNCTYYDNGKIGKIRANILELEPYKNFDAISEIEAYERIKDGKFVCYGNQKREIQLGNVSLDYMIDSKGYFQPVYIFETKVDGVDSEIRIPAVE